MADLQSFFAKKDKKKKSKKPETFTPDDLMKKIEQDTQGYADAGYDSNGDTKNPPRSAPLTLPNSGKDDEEWNEFETDKEVDLSTLKIQNLGEKEKERQEENDQESLKKAVEVSKSTMKWNIHQEEFSDDDENQQDEEETREKDVEGKEVNGTATGDKDTEQQSAASESKSAGPGSDGKYIPPALRAVLEGRSGPPSVASGASLAPVSLKRGGNQSRNLDVNSIDQFPSLGATVQSAGGAWGAGAPGQDGAGAFTSVRKGARGTSDGPDHSALSTSNKYSMLKGQNRT